LRLPGGVKARDFAGIEAALSRNILADADRLGRGRQVAGAVAAEEVK